MGGASRERSRGDPPRDQEGAWPLAALHHLGRNGRLGRRQGLLPLRRIVRETRSAVHPRLHRSRQAQRDPQGDRPA